jgi:hypothetical protein
LPLPLEVQLLYYSKSTWQAATLRNRNMSKYAPFKIRDEKIRQEVGWYFAC